MTGILAAIGVLLLVVIVTLAAASFFQHMLAATVTLTAVPVSVMLFALVGAYDTVFALATLAIIGCLIHTITDTFRLARTPRLGPPSLSVSTSSPSASQAFDAAASCVLRRCSPSSALRGSPWPPPMPTGSPQVNTNSRRLLSSIVR